MKQYLKAVKVLYGRGHGEGPKELEFVGAPYEGESINLLELILHELSHQVQNPTLKIKDLGEHIGTLTKFQANRHEIKAVAIELKIAEQLQVPITLDKLLVPAWRNLRSTNGCYPDIEKVRAAILRAKRTPEVLELAQKVTSRIKKRVKAQQK